MSFAPRTKPKKMVPTEMLFFKIGRSVERIDRHAKWRPRDPSVSGQRRFLGENRSDRSPPQRLAQSFHRAGDVDVLFADRRRD